MRILVVGASGLVGQHVYAEATATGHQLLGTYRRHPVDGLEPLDLADQVVAQHQIDGFKPDWIVHAAGMTWVDGCEKDPALAMEMNCAQPLALARLCRERGIRMVYFSTTYVFDGREGPYTELDQPNPLNAYGRSKYMGEEAVQTELGERALIPRLICVWGKEAQRKNFAYQVAEAVEKQRPLTVPNDQIGNPTWAGDVAYWATRLMERNAGGVWNLCSDSAGTTRVEWTEDIVDGLKARPDTRQAAERWRFEQKETALIGQVALRPLNAGGINKKIQAMIPRDQKRPGDIGVLFS